MLLPDANVFLHAVNEPALEHEAAYAWLDETLQGTEAIGIAWVVALAFLRLTTHPSIFARSLTTERAAATLEAWMDEPQVIMVEPTRRHLPLLRGLLVATGTAGKLVSDAHLAALALEHDATVVSFDRDFGRFEGVSWRLPGAL
ncbi:MAG: type II toxin-antitoxin system VapC family toxin [Actinomycetota bacterium]|nr:type II toxin-antitoxin system VapC family toxin [Actinomycetota bacterium]